MTRVRALLAALSTLAVVGCAQTKPPPIALSQEADAAKVRFVNRVERAWIDLYPETNCNGGTNIIHDVLVARLVKSMSEGPRRAGMLDPPSPEDSNVAEYSFRPGQVINVGIGGSGGRSCIGGLSFVSAPATQYEVVLSRTSPERCSISVSVLYLEGGTVQRQPFRALRPLVCKGAYR